MGALVTEHGWKVSTQFADRATLAEFTRTAKRTVSRSGSTASSTSPPRTATSTDSPRNSAKRCSPPTTGYFSVPRGAVLTDLAAELDATTSAISERLRVRRPAIDHTCQLRTVTAG